MSDYKPFGNINYDNKLVDLKNDYRFTGKELDEENGLQYFGARYNDNQLGKFISIDPATLVLYNEEEFKDKYKRTATHVLEDPQNLNSYSYAVNNPVKNIDPDGEIADTIADVGFIAYDLGRIVTSYVKTGHVEKSEFTALGADVTGALVPGVTGLGIVSRVANKADNVSDVVKAVNDVKKFDATVQQTKMLKGIENTKAINTIKSVFKPSDTIPGGTMGALRNEINTGLMTKDKFHIKKADNVINNIKNVLKSEKLSKVEVNRLQGIRNSLKSLMRNIKF